MKLIIAGLRRSGTTIFWETFRQDPRLLCYDEPFNPNLWVLPGRSGLKAPEEFNLLLDRDPAAFWERFSPIHFSQELREGLSDREADWLRHLGGTGDRVAVDVTRCLFKLAALHAIAPDAVLVHLYRPAESFASSHMLPTSRGRRGALRKLVHRRGFFTRPGGYNGWSFESIIGNSTRSLFAKRLGEAGLDPEQVYAMPAVARLMAYWKVAFERAEGDGRRLFGERFVSQGFDEFCLDPRESVERVYRALGMAPAQLDYGRIHPANGPYQLDSPQWARYRAALELPELT